MLIVSNRRRVITSKVHRFMDASLLVLVYGGSAYISYLVLSLI